MFSAAKPGTKKLYVKEERGTLNRPSSREYHKAHIISGIIEI